MTVEQGNATETTQTESRAVLAEPTAEGRRGARKTREGRVVSNKMNKTVVIAVEDRFKHPLYGKVVRRTSKLKAHDEQNACRIGDRVLVMETRPLSKSKRWRVVEVLDQAK